MEEEKKEHCFPFWRYSRKVLLDTLTIGFVTGACVTVGLIKLLGISKE